MRDTQREGWTTRDEALAAQNDQGEGFLLRMVEGCWLEESEADEDPDAEDLWEVTDETGCYVLFPADEIDAEDLDTKPAKGEYIWVLAEH